jgi:hypothetical protein
MRTRFKVREHCKIAPPFSPQKITLPPDFLTWPMIARQRWPDREGLMLACLPHLNSKTGVLRRCSSFCDRDCFSLHRCRYEKSQRKCTQQRWDDVDVPYIEAKAPMAKHRRTQPRSNPPGNPFDHETVKSTEHPVSHNHVEHKRGNEMKPRIKRARNGLKLIPIMVLSSFTDLVHLPVRIGPRASMPLLGQMRIASAEWYGSRYIYRSTIYIIVSRLAETA